MNLALRHVFVAALGLVACNETHSGQKPVGGSVDTEAEIQRFLRNTYLDLTGKAPTDDEMATATARLQTAGNTPTARGELIGELLSSAAYTMVWVEELENSIFGGNDLETQYTFVCGIIRGTTQACNTCTEPTDHCACNCGPLPMYFDERAALRLVPVDFADGVASSTLEREYAASAGYYALSGAPDTRVRTLFDDFLQRPAEADEIENGRSMIFALSGSSPAGLLFHRHGANYADLIDIVFSSEVYREAVVRRTFDRYLQRQPTSIELAHFTSTLDAAEPDLRDVVRAVISSREYFER